MADQVSESNAEGKLDDKPTTTTEKREMNQTNDTPGIPRNDRFKVRQVGFIHPENPNDSPEEKKEEPEDSEEQDKFDDEMPKIESNNIPESPHENFTHGYATNEALPMTVFYRNTLTQVTGAKHRPTMQELRKGLESDSPFQPLVEQVQDDKAEEHDLDIIGNSASAPKFGWIKGVLFGCLLNIWGVMLYLRLSWVVGQAGIGMATIIILLSAVVTFLTTLSMSAICTNGEVKGGGAYFLISRSLGPEFGGAIGVIFSIANAVAIAMYVVGFSETVRDLLKDKNALMIDEVNDIRIIGLITVIFVFGVAIVGMEWVVRTQVVLLAILIISILNVIIGSFIGPQSAEAQAKGFTGYDKVVFSVNMKPAFVGEGFFSVFAVFFPAATGILAGVNISGDLKNVNSAIPKGTMIAILISSLVYITLAWIVGATYLREATGIVAVAQAANATISNGTEAMSCFTESCKYGLLHDFQVMEKLSGWGPIVTAGIFASTLSSALASFVGAPKTFQAVCKDKLFPKIEFFAVGHGPGNEPRRGYILAFLIAVAFIAIGELNAIAPIISNFFLICYALINYAVFVASLGRSPGWRPSFRYYNMWVSLVGALLCIVIMFLIKWWSALLTIIICVGLYKFVDHRKPEVNWGSSGHANTYMTALRLTNRLEAQSEHVKNFRPQFLALSGRPSHRPNLLYIVSQMSKNLGLMIYGNVYEGDLGTIPEEQALEDRKWLQEHKIKAFRASTIAPTVRAGVQSMYHLCGLGKMRPNTVVIEYKENWKSTSKVRLDNYFGMINDAFDFKYGLCILRMGGKEIDFEVGVSDSVSEENEVQTPDLERGTQEPLNSQKAAPNPGSGEIAFKEKQRGTIDVWWLYDDGGLTVLLPYLLTQHRVWGGCQLRLFSLDIRSKHSIKATELKMANLMKKFRITVSSVEQVSGANVSPSEKSLDAFRMLPVGKELEDGIITDQKVLRTIRIGELVRERSKAANLVVISLPIPVAEVTTPNMYMSMLEVLSADLPPVLLIRGNQSSVLTFYS